MQPLRHQRAPLRVVSVDELFHAVEERQEAQFPGFLGYRIAIPKPEQPPRPRKRGSREGRPNS